MKRILFASMIGLVFTSCQKQIDVSSNSANIANSNGTNTSYGVSTTVTPESLNKDLIAYYSFSGNANDVSGNGYDGLVNGATLTTDRFGKANSAYYFGNNSGTNILSNYIEINNLHTNPILNYTISGWFQKDASSVDHEGSIFAGDQPLNSPSDFKFAIAADNSAQWNAKYKSNIAVGVTNQATTTGSANYSDGIWHSFSVTFKAATTGTLTPSNFQIFIDGVQVTTQGLFISDVTHEAAPANNTSLPVILGNIQGTHTSGFPGKLDEIRIFNRVLTQQEITYLAN
ncbi:MAG: LamG-like jellyroll fold domain-containing protein [Bacteroidota bacterium]